MDVKMFKSANCHVPHGKTMVLCIICGVTLPKPINCITEHCSGSKHIDNVRLMSYHGLTVDIPSLTLFCRPCKTYIERTDDVICHIKSTVHDTWYQAMRNLDGIGYINCDDYLSMRSDTAFCVSCDSDLECSLLVLEEHLKSFAHKNSQCSLLKRTNAMVVKGDKLWCKMCEVEMDDEIETVIDHVVKKTNHLENLRTIEDLIQDQGIYIHDYLTIGSETTAYCMRCDFKMLCHPTRIECHIHTECHSLRII